MPITDASLPIRFLNILQTIGTRFVVLHQETELGQPTLLSDLDLAVDSPSDHIIGGMREPLKAAGLKPVIRWPYDVGGATTYFLSTESGFDGMQVDLLHDPDGRGKYGVRTMALLEEASTGSRYPVPSPLDQHLYLVQKAWVKSQPERLEAELREVRKSAQPGIAYSRAGRLFSPEAADTVLKLLTGDTPKARFKPTLRPDNLWRLSSRIIHPIGFWVDLVGPEQAVFQVAKALHDRLDSWVIHTGLAHRPTGPGEYYWWTRRVAPVRMRPGVFVSFGASPAVTGADLTLEWEPGLTPDEVGTLVVEAMSSRLEQ